MRTVPIVMAFDRGYVRPACVAIFSILETARPEDEYRFYLLASEEDFGMDSGFFELLAGRFPNFSWEYRRMDPSVFAGVRHPMRYVSVSSYYRMLIPRLFPELDRCLYLDADLMACSDVGELLDLCDMPAFGKCCFAAAKDLGLQAGDNPLYEEHRLSIGFTPEELRGYVNAGVLVMNLRRIREEGLEERFLALVPKNYAYGDQDILNIVCKGRILRLPIRCNLVASNIGNRERVVGACEGRDREDALLGRPVLCHFDWQEKPWQFVETLWEQRWLACARRMPATPELAAWVAQCGERQGAPWRDRAGDLRAAGEVVLYGYTFYARRLCGDLLDTGVGSIRCFCDRSPAKQGQSFRGVPCRGPEELDALGPGALIVICSQTAWPEIRAELNARGFGDERLARYRFRDFAVISV